MPGFELEVPSAIGTKTTLSQGVRVIIGGESHAVGTSANSPIAHSPTEPLSWAQFLSGGRFDYVYNAGVGTTSIADFLTRLDTIESYDPDVIVHLGGTYETDPARSISLATYKAGIVEFVEWCTSRDIIPIVGTTFPSLSNGNGSRTRVEDQNLWLRQWVPANGGHILETYLNIIDATTGAIQTALRDGSGVHANGAGNKIIGQALADLLDRLLPAWTPPLAGHQTTETMNIIDNALFLTDAGADGIPDGWSELQANNASIVAGDTSILGNWLRVDDIDGNLASVSFNNSQIADAQWDPGDVIAFCGGFDHVKGTSAKTLTIQASFASGSPNSVRPVSVWDTDITGGIFYVETTIPTGTTGLSVAVIRNDGTQGAGGYSRVFQMTLLNLTKREALTL